MTLLESISFSVSLFLLVLRLELRAYTLSHSTALFFLGGGWVFWDRTLQTICLGWFQTTILPISATWVASIAGVSYWCQVFRLCSLILDVIFKKFLYFYCVRIWTVLVFLRPWGISLVYLGSCLYFLNVGTHSL
jgi:hypothetical protein